jgi:hypothetical protein
MDGLIHSSTLVLSPTLMRPSVAAGEPPNNERTSTSPSAHHLVRVCEYMCAWICVCVHVCTCIYACTHIHTCVYAYTSAYLKIFCAFKIHVYNCVCFCARIHHSIVCCCRRKMMTLTSWCKYMRGRLGSDSQYSHILCKDLMDQH